MCRSLYLMFSSLLHKSQSNKESDQRVLVDLGLRTPGGPPASFWRRSTRPSTWNHHEFPQKKSKVIIKKRHLGWIQEALISGRDWKGIRNLQAWMVNDLPPQALPPLHPSLPAPVPTSSSATSPSSSGRCRTRQSCWRWWGWAGPSQAPQIWHSKCRQTYPGLCLTDWCQIVKRWSWKQNCLIFDFV